MRPTIITIGKGVNFGGESVLHVTVNFSQIMSTIFSGQKIFMTMVFSMDAFL